MTTLTWHLIRAKAVLDEWYEMAEKSLALIDKYPVTHWTLQALRHKQNADCKRNALVCKTRGLIYHDQYELLLDKCWREIR